MIKETPNSHRCHKKKNMVTVRRNDIQVRTSKRNKKWNKKTVILLKKKSVFLIMGLEYGRVLRALLISKGHVYTVHQ